MKYKQCQVCDQRSEDVVDTFCPYDQEIHEINTPITVCRDCYDEISMEI